MRPSELLNHRNLNRSAKLPKIIIMFWDFESKKSSMLTNRGLNRTFLGIWGVSSDRWYIFEHFWPFAPSLSKFRRSGSPKSLKTPENIRDLCSKWQHFLNIYLNILNEARISPFFNGPANNNFQPDSLKRIRLILFPSEKNPKIFIKIRIVLLHGTIKLNGNCCW